jgi:hypothetical protein
MYRREINKYIKQNCAASWIYLQDYTGMHGQQNIKSFLLLSQSRLECLKDLSKYIIVKSLPEYITTPEMCLK